MLINRRCAYVEEFMFFYIEANKVEFVQLHYIDLPRPFRYICYERQYCRLAFPISQAGRRYVPLIH